MSADLMAAGLQSGCAPFSSAASPLTCGHAMEVPETMLKSTRRASLASSVGPLACVHPARMLTPGAITSGFSITGTTGLGPRDENAATTGDGWTSTLVFPMMIVAFGGGITPDLVSVLLPDGYRRKDARSRNELLAVDCSIGEDHSDAACGLHDGTLFASPVDTGIAQNDFSGHLLRDQRPIQTEAATHRVASVASIDERQYSRCRQGYAIVERDTAIAFAVAEDCIRRKVSVNRARADGHDPGSNVRDGGREWAIVPAGTRDEEASLHGSEGAYGNGVEEEVCGLAAEGKRKDVHPIADCLLHCTEDIRAIATAGPAHLVGGDASTRCHSSRRPGCITEEARAGDARATGRARRVRAVAVVVSRRSRLNGA
ncbi:hypothetical protein EJ110_NYTH09629 [Nymphaea thermarum]|nr:hypothetical protein EJ110_NYTH09629 [Nymphaea thermarum]